MYHNDVQQIEHEAMPITKYFETRRVKDRLTMHAEETEDILTWHCCEVQSMSEASTKCQLLLLSVLR